MNKCFLPKITDYWDANRGVPHPFWEVVTQAKGNDRALILQLIQDSITEHVRVLSDENLCNAAFVMVDDLYKSANNTAAFDEGIRQYLGASAGVFSALFSKRGYVIHYIVDNEFSNTEIGVERPLGLFPLWFRASGLAYICPQELALHLMKADGINRSEFCLKLSQYVREARYVSDKVLDSCHSENRHYVFLDLDSTDTSFGKAFSSSDMPGVLTIFRNEAPIQGSKCEVGFPTRQFSGGQET